MADGSIHESLLGSAKSPFLKNDQLGLLASGHSIETAESAPLEQQSKIVEQ